MSSKIEPGVSSWLTQVSLRCVVIPGAMVARPSMGGGRKMAPFAHSRAVFDLSSAAITLAKHTTSAAHPSPPAEGSKAGQKDRTTPGEVSGRAGNFSDGVHILLNCGGKRDTRFPHCLHTQGRSL